MVRNSKHNHLKFKTIALVIKASGLASWTALFALLFLVCAAIVAVFEPNIGGFGNAAWFLFEVVTTIGLGDYTAVSIVGRAVAIVLSIYSIFFIAIVTGVVVSSCTELMQAKRNQSVVDFIDKLERLPELSKEELAALSDQAKELHKKL